MPERNRGIIRITQELLLSWLQFEGGTVIDARVNNWESSGTIEVIIEHPEMPTVREGDVTQIVYPSYTKKTSKTGRILSIKRQPLKK